MQLQCNKYIEMPHISSLKWICARFTHSNIKDVHHFRVPSPIFTPPAALLDHFSHFLSPPTRLFPLILFSTGAVRRRLYFSRKELTQFIPPSITLVPLYPEGTRPLYLLPTARSIRWISGFLAQAEWRTCCVVRFKLSSVQEHKHTHAVQSRAKCWLKELQLETSAGGCLCKWTIKYMTEEVICHRGKRHS